MDLKIEKVMGEDDRASFEVDGGLGMWPCALVVVRPSVEWVGWHGLMDLNMKNQNLCIVNMIQI